MAQPESGASNAESGSSIDRFKALAKGLFGVSRAAYQEHERNETDAKKTARVAPRGPLK